MNKFSNIYQQISLNKNIQLRFHIKRLVSKLDKIGPKHLMKGGESFIVISTVLKDNNYTHGSTVRLTAILLATGTPEP